MAKNILLIEDNDASRRLMKEAFKAADMKAELHIAENGDEAAHFLGRIAAFEVPRPDLILLDLNLPGRSGSEILAGIKNDPLYRDIPVVVLTGSGAEADIKKCAEYCCQYLLKPSRFYELIDLVKTFPRYYAASAIQ